MLKRMKKVYAFILMGTICVQPVYAINHIPTESANESIIGEKMNEQVMELLDNARFEKTETIGDIVLEEQEKEGENLAQGKSVKASTVHSSSYEAEKAVDGDKVTRWASKGRDNQWFEIDFGKEVTFNTLIINEFISANEQTRLSDFNFQYWDQSKWVRFYDGSNGVKPVYYFETVTTQKLKIDMPRSANEPTFYEVEVYQGGIEELGFEQEKYIGQKGSKHILKPVIIPDYANSIPLIWESSQPEIASVDNEGVVTFHQVGTAQITISTMDESKSGMCELEVVDSLTIESITLKKEIRLVQNEEMQLIPIIKPDGVVGVPITWESTNPMCVSVDEKGNIQALTEGEAEIIATTIEGKEATCLVKVSAPIKNIIPNGDFERSSGMMPSEMKITNKVGSSVVTMDSKQSYMGDSSVKLSSQEVGTIVIEPSNNNLLAKDSEIYRLSVRAKGNKQGSGKVKFKYTHKKGGRTALTTYSQVLEVNEDWQELTILCDPMQSTSGQSVFLEVDVQTGDIWVDEWRLEKLQRYDKLELPENLVVDISKGIQSIAVPLTKDEGVNKDERLLWITSNEEILTVENGIIVPKQAGTAKVTVMTLDRIIRDSCEVTIIGQIPADQIVEVASISLDQKEAELENGRTMELKAAILPSHATDTSLTWTSSDEAVATVMDGRVIGKSEGQTTITAAAGNGIYQTCEVTVKQSKEDDFTTMIKAWSTKSNLKVTDEILERVKVDWETMDKNSCRKGLWYEPTVTVPRVWQSDKINEDANRLRQMAIAATMEDSPLKGNKELIQDTVSGTMWLYKNCFSLNNFMGYTWWQWEIGIPQIINDIFVMMNPYFTEEEIKEVMGFIHNTLMPYPEYMEYIAGGRLPNTGANLTDQVKVALVPAMFMKDAVKIERCKELVLDSLNFVESGDGFYEDGSFIQHGDIAYTGSYGAVYLGGITSILDIFEGTSHAVSGKQAERLYKIVEDAYLPLMYKGPIMDMVNGRAIVRKNSNDHMGGAHNMVVDIIRLAQSAPEPYRTSILEQCKYLIESDTLCDYTQGTSQYITNVINKLLADESIIAKQPESTHKEYGGMNRTVHHEPNFSVGISKSSNRIKTYEVTNHENQKGWHTGDGMMYLYNNDLNHYDGDYWVTVNWDRLPGVTADPNRSRNWGSQSSGDAQARPKNTWSGGVEFQNKYGTSGMNLQAIDGKVATDLTANKSWFMFDDVVIAIGSSINNTDNRMIETTIEQRRIQGNNKLLVDGGELMLE